MFDHQIMENIKKWLPLLLAAAIDNREALGQVFNLGYGEDVTIGNLVETVLEILDTDIPVETDSQRIRPEKSEVMRLNSDNRRARDYLQWQPHVTLKMGLAATIDWIRDNLEAFRIGRYEI